MLTGNKNIDTIILNKLDDKDLVNICQVNKLADQICKDQMFWFNRILIKFNLPLEILDKYKGDRSWSEYYINDLRKLSGNWNDMLIDGSRTGRLDHVMIALNNGANIHYDDDYPVRVASGYNHLDIVKYLVSVGANIHGLNDEAIRWASLNGNLDMVKYLVSVNADIHAIGDTSVYWAYDNGHLDVVEYLVSLGSTDPR